MIKYRSGYKYQLAETYRVQTALRPAHNIFFTWTSLNKDGVLEILKDYAWDGPSGPTLDTKSAMRGSLVHDAIYQLIRLGRLSDEERKTADEEYRRICREDGMSRARAWLHFSMLRAFGAGAAYPKSERPILIAP